MAKVQASVQLSQTEQKAWKVCRILGACVGVGILNAFAAACGLWTGLTINASRPSLFLASIALGLYGGIIVPLVVTLGSPRSVSRRAHGNPAIASYVIIGICLLGAACLAIPLKGLAAIPGMLSLIGAVAGLICAPFAFLLWNKRFEWVVLCMAIGGVVAFIVWTLGFAYIDPYFGGSTRARMPKPHADLVEKAMFVVPVLSIIGSMIIVAFKARRWHPLPLMPAPLTHCLECDYDLRGLPGTTVQCPECGTPMPAGRMARNPPALKPNTIEV